MKYKKIVSVVLAFALLFSITSCGSAPAEEQDVSTAADKAPFKPEVVISDDKTDDTEEETEQETPLEEGQERVSTSFTSEDGAITYNIDAVMTGTDITSLSTFTVTSAIYTPEELELISKTLAGDSVVYAFSETVARPVLEEMLIENKEYIADRDALMEYYDNNEDIVNYRIEEVSGEIADIERDLPYAPEELQKPEPDYSYRPDVEYAEGKRYVFNPTFDKSTTFRALTDIDGAVKEIIVFASEFGSDVWLHDDTRINSTFQRNRWNCYQIEPFTEAEIEAAKEDVLNTLHEMGFDNWVIESCVAYETDLDEFYEGKDTEGLPITSGVVYDLDIRLVCEFEEPVRYCYVGEKSWKSHFDGTDYENPLEVSGIHLKYSKGRIIEFYGTDLYKVERESGGQTLFTYTEAVDKISELLPQVWDGEMISQYYSAVTGSVSNDRVILEADVSVDRIELVYVSVPIDEDTFELAPAWAVFGRPTLTEYKIGNANIRPSSMQSSGALIPAPRIPILVVNAIDGSVIKLADSFHYY